MESQALVEATKHEESEPQQSVSIGASFPDEIIDVIIKCAGQFDPADRDKEGRVSESRSEKASLLACALVNHRWYRITLPYLFRCVTIWEPKDAHTVVVETEDDIAGFLRFVLERPAIALLIQEITFKNCLIYIASLIDVLKALPSLQVLDLSGAKLLGTGNVPSTYEGGLTVKKLLWFNSTCDSEDESVSGILPFFARIGELAIWTRHDTALLSLRKTATHHLHHLRIDKLNLCHPHKLFTSTLSLGILTFGGKSKSVPLFRYVTELSLACSTLWDFHFLGQFLLGVSATLAELQLYVDREWETRTADDPVAYQNKLDEVLHRPLSACTALHTLRLALKNRKGPGFVPFRDFEESWIGTLGSILASDIIRFTNPSALKHLEFHFWPNYGYHVENVLDDFAWSDWRIVLRPFVNLQCLSIWIETYESSSGVAERIRQGLKEFQHVLRLDQERMDRTTKELSVIIDSESDEESDEEPDDTDEDSD